MSETERQNELRAKVRAYVREMWGALDGAMRPVPLRLLSAQFGRAIRREFGVDPGVWVESEPSLIVWRDVTTGKRTLCPREDFEEALVETGLTREKLLPVMLKTTKE